MIGSGFLYPPLPFGCEDYFRQDRRWCKLRKSENCPSKRHFVRILRAWYPNVHLQRETCCGSQNSLQQLARKFANVFLCRRRFICNHSGLNAVYYEPRWRPSTVDSEQLWEALTQGGFEAGSKFCFWIKWVYFGTASALLTIKSFTKGLLNAIDDMCFDMFCVCKTLWNCVTKPQTCVWEQMASLGKSLEEWISWLSSQRGRGNERKRMPKHQNQRSYFHCKSLQLVQRKQSEYVMYDSSWINLTNSTLCTDGWNLDDGCLASLKAVCGVRDFLWILLDIGVRHRTLRMLYDTLRFLVAQHVKVMDRILNTTLHWAHAKNLRPAAFGIVYVFVMSDFTPTTNDRQKDIVSNSNVNCLGVCLVAMNWANGDYLCQA